MLNRKQIFDAITNDGKRDIAGTEVQSIINRLMDLQSQQTQCTTQLPQICSCVAHTECECIYNNKCSECGLPLR